MQPTKITILIISGKQGSGKTTLTENIVRRLFMGSRIRTREVMFAETIKRVHDYGRGLITDAFEGQDMPDYIREYFARTAVKDGDWLQDLGTKWGRQGIGQQVWVDVARAKMLKFAKNEGALYEHVLFIPSDCRFENEFDAFPEALSVRLNCREEVRKARSSYWRENTSHPSEVGLDDYDRKGKFDMYFNTELESVAQITELVIAQILKGNWLEKRKA